MTHPDITVGGTHRSRSARRSSQPPTCSRPTSGSSLTPREPGCTARTRKASSAPAGSPRSKAVRLSLFGDHRGDGDLRVLDEPHAPPTESPRRTLMHRVALPG